ARPESEFAWGSNAGHQTDMADEIVCFSLDPNRNSDGSLDVLVVGQVMTDLFASGGGTDDYSKRPKGNIDVTGRYFIWTTNLGGDRLDAFIVKIPVSPITPQLKFTMDGIKDPGWIRYENDPGRRRRAVNRANRD